MVVTQIRRKVRAPGTRDVVDVTDEVATAVAESGIGHGRVEIFSPARSAPLLVNERESGLLLDIRNAIDRARVSTHDYDAGSSWVAVPIAEGRLRLGMWQRVMMLELDEPRTRELVINVLGEEQAREA